MDGVMAMALGDPGALDGATAPCSVCGKTVYRDVLQPTDLLHRDPLDFPHTAELDHVIPPMVTVTIGPDGSRDVVSVVADDGVQVVKMRLPRARHGAIDEWTTDPAGTARNVTLGVNLGDVESPHDAARQFLQVLRNAPRTGLDLDLIVPTTQAARQRRPGTSGLRRFARLLLGAARHPYIALRGMLEFRCGSGLTFDDAESPRSVAYDCGRELAHLLTRRHFDG
ncbi:hypothetical protein NQK81_01540 [Amycolatopsis roodepoortensis]|uniref:hypothetical protein n=1 Tax=Amycolatopsis roodepoortensis TaxID=700274 RepID=UPI00214D0934|nr:hypothetical protein [Amycolatopsis roodepoortensis]UUV32159.1 hypothetical protein NQK81_01540 [Amycolatopsis roodepoortensis]